MSAGVKYSTLPENADKILFAEDLVNHILSKLDLSLLSSGIADHRALIYNAFNPEIRLAVNSAYNDYDARTTNEFKRFLKKKALNINDFINYVQYFKSRVGAFVSDESKAPYFLLLCLKLSFMAGKFYMHGISDAPNLAVGHIVSIIEGTDMVEGGGWEALNTVARRWSRSYIDLNKICLTPEYDRDSNSSNSPDSESEGDEDPDEQSTDEEYDKIFIHSCSSSSEEPFTSSSGSKGFEKTYSGEACNFASSDNALDSASVGSSKVKNSEVSFHSFQDISKEDDSSIQNANKYRNDEPSCSYNEESKFYSKKCKTDVQRADDIDPILRQLTEERSGIFISRANELYKSDSARLLEISNSDNLTAENANKSSTEDKGEVQTSAEESGRRKKSVSK